MIKIMALTLIVVFSGLANAKDHTKKIDFAEPPFWMASFEEFSDLRKVQKEFYLDGLLEQLKKNKALSKFDQGDVHAASKKPADWEKLMTLVYEFCGEVKNQKSCLEIAQVRLKTLEAYGNERLENRTLEH